MILVTIVNIAKTNDFLVETDKNYVLQMFIDFFQCK